MAEEKEPERKKLSLQGNKKLSLGGGQDFIKTNRNNKRYVENLLKPIHITTKAGAWKPAPEKKRQTMLPFEPPALRSTSGHALTQLRLACSHA